MAKSGAIEVLIDHKLWCACSCILMFHDHTEDRRVDIELRQLGKRRKRLEKQLDRRTQNTDCVITFLLKVAVSVVCVESWLE